MAGDIDDGIALLKESLRDCPAIYFSAVIGVFLAQALLARGNPVAAIEAAKENLQLSRNLGYRAHEAETLRVLGEALVNTDLRHAEDFARQALDLSVTLGLRPDEAHSRRILADIQERTGAHEAAEQSRSCATALYTELKMVRWLEPASNRSAG